MRQVILDTETTGLKPASGHRIIEIGCVELKDRRKTDRVLHYYINPEREIEEAAVEIHGITEEQLQGEPVFADIADPFIDFIRDSEVIMHSFDAALLMPIIPPWRRMGRRRYCGFGTSISRDCPVPETAGRLPRAYKVISNVLHGGRRRTADHADVTWQ